MTIRSYKGFEPHIHPDAYVDPAATVIGDVVIEADASVWPNVVLRGDHGAIYLREGANVQDNSVVHEGAEIGRYATVGHTAILHGCEVGNRALIGMGAIVLNEAVVGTQAMVGAAALVTKETKIPDHTVAMGSPAEIVRESEQDEPVWAAAGDVYTDLADSHKGESEVLYDQWPPTTESYD
jgi:carbonic anhydrase/acetyltransferase-like protein (isoleucine patch superfamily)